MDSIKLVNACILAVKMVKTIAFVEKNLQKELFAKILLFAMNSMDLVFVRNHVLKMVKTIALVAVLEGEQFVQCSTIVLDSMNLVYVKLLVVIMVKTIVLVVVLNQ